MASEVTQALLKALEAGNYNAAPSTLVQGSALQIEDLSPVMNNVTYDDSHIKLQKMLKVDPVKSTLAQFDRQLSYGIFGATAQNEGAVGQEEMSEYVRIVVPMAYYSHVRRVTVVANLVATVDGVKAEERAASDGAKKIAGDIEFDSFRGKADFSNAGLFDGSMLAIPGLPKILSAYNKISFGKERIILAGAPQDATSADLRRQWVSGGTVNVEASRFLSGKTRPATARSSSPGAPSIALTDNAAQGTSAPAGTYNYYASAVNERGESVKSTSVTVTIAAGDSVTVTITPPGSGVVRYFNVFRSNAGGNDATSRFIGRVSNSGAATTTFLDLFNKNPGFVTGFLIQGDTMALKELAPYSRLKLAVTDLSIPEAHFRFVTLAVMHPRKNVLVDNLRGAF